MGLYFRKSIKLNKFMRVNFSKTGVSLSATIPGTGIRYSTKKVGLSQLANNSTRSSSRRTSSSLPYSQTVTNEYTGESRTIRAATTWELRNMVENEQERQKRNELRQRSIENANNQRERAEELTRQQI